MIYDETYYASLNQNLKSVKRNVYSAITSVIKCTSKVNTRLFYDYLWLMTSIIFLASLNNGITSTYIRTKIDITKSSNNYRLF